MLHALNHALVKRERLRLENAAHQLIHDDAVQLIALRKRVLVKRRRHLMQTVVERVHQNQAVLREKARKKFAEGAAVRFFRPVTLHQVLREQVAALMGARPQEIVFTSGGTESDNHAIFGVVGQALLPVPSSREANFPPHIITTAIEHEAVLNTCQALEKEGVRVTYLPTDREGQMELEELRRAIRQETVLITIMHANNELGTVQPLEEIGRIAKAADVCFHTDAVQSAGKIPIDVNALQVDLLSISGHKVYGPKGVGALYVRRRPRARIAPLLDGGGQERGLRSGTLPTPLIVGWRDESHDRMSLNDVLREFEIGT